MVVSSTTAALVAFGAKIAQGIIRRRQQQKLKLDARRGIRAEIIRASGPLYRAVREEFGDEIVMKFDELAGRTFDGPMRGAGGHWQGLDELIPGAEPGGGVKSVVGSKHRDKVQALQTLLVYWNAVADAAAEYEQAHRIMPGKAALLAAFVAYKGARGA